MQILIVGATGLVGDQVLNLALNDERVSHVIAPVRRSIQSHPKLSAPIVDYDRVDSWNVVWNEVDAVICTLGTTIKIAGSKSAFYQVDHDYPLMVAKIAKEHGVKVFALNSATGANANSKIFYNQVKGKTEQDLKALGFESLTFVRPALIDGKRKEFRLAEKLGLMILKPLNSFLPKGWRVSPVDHIAKFLLDSAIESKPGIQIIEADKLAN